MRFNVISIFPQIITEALRQGVVGQAVIHGPMAVQVVNPRDFSEGSHQRVDDRPFGGGDGMVLMIDPLLKALESLSDQGRVVYLSPQGKPWTDRLARDWAKSSQPLTLICGRYAGVDQRFINSHVDDEISIGDYVLSGGELPALVLMDSIARFLPGVLGNAISPHQESFSQDRLEGPVFTRPQNHELGQVPRFLTSGDHRSIERFKQALAVVVTGLRRPDLGSTSEDFKQAMSLLLTLPAGDLEALGLKKQMVAPPEELA